MTGTDQHVDSRAAYEAWTEHRWFAYRGCAPDPDEPRLAADGVVREGKRVRVPLDAWCGEDRDGPERQRERTARQEAAIEVCLSCPVMVQCGVYASSVTPEGKLAAPDGIRGGRTARERREEFAVRRHEVMAAAPDVQVQTDQKRDVLLALAMCPDGDAVAVAAAAGVPVRTANWQRSRLVTQFSLCKVSATRMELLAEAVRRGLLDVSVVVADDGSVPAWSPAAPSSASSPAGQLPLWQPGPDLADVVPLHPVQAQEAAA